MKRLNEQLEDQLEIYRRNSNLLENKCRELEGKLVDVMQERDRLLKQLQDQSEQLELLRQRPPHTPRDSDTATPDRVHRKDMASDGTPLRRQVQAADPSDLRTPIGSLQLASPPGKLGASRALGVSMTENQLFLQTQEQQQRIDQLELLVRKEKRERVLAEDLRKQAVEQVDSVEKRMKEMSEELRSELKKRHELASMLAQRDRQVPEYPIEDLANRQAAQGKIIAKDMQVCDLQQQLADELEKRQEVQRMLILKDRTILDLQVQNAELRCSMPQGRSQANSPCRPAEHRHRTCCRQGFGHESDWASAISRGQRAGDESEKGLGAICEASEMSQGQHGLQHGLQHSLAHRPMAPPRFHAPAWTGSPTMQPRSPMASQSHRSIVDPTPSPAMRSGGPAALPSWVGSASPNITQPPAATQKIYGNAPRLSSTARMMTSSPPAGGQQPAASWGLPNWWPSGPGAARSMDDRLHGPRTFS